jgi:hypothetical protein
MPKGTPASDQDYAPYAPYKSVHDVIVRYRERGLPDPLTPAALGLVGVADGMTARTLRALRFLGLIDEAGARQAPLERLKQATTSEYPEQLAEIVRAAYLPVFTIVNPAEDSDTAIADAFRRFEPSAQRGKMIALFRSLCEEAQIITQTAPRSRPASRRATPDAASQRSKQVVVQKRPDPPSLPDHKDDETATPDYRLISAVIQQLPRSGKWTRERRDRWLLTLTSAVDLLFEQTDDHSDTSDAGADGGTHE